MSIHTMTDDPMWGFREVTDESEAMPPCCEVYFYRMWRPREEALAIIRERRDSAMERHGDGPHRWRAMDRHNRWIRSLGWLTPAEAEELRCR